MENRISITIPAEVTAQVLAKFKEIETLLQPYAVVVADDDKSGLLKLGDKTLPFVNKTLGYSETAPEFAPTYLDSAEFKRDTQALQALEAMYQPALQLLQLLEDTRALAGNDAYVSSLIYYHSVKQAATNGVAKGKTIYEDLSQRFPGKARKSNETPKS